MPVSEREALYVHVLQFLISCGWFEGQYGKKRLLSVERKSHMATFLNAAKRFSFPSVQEYPEGAVKCHRCSKTPPKENTIPRRYASINSVPMRLQTSEENVSLWLLYKRYNSFIHARKILLCVLCRSGSPSRTSTWRQEWGSTVWGSGPKSWRSLISEIGPAPCWRTGGGR